MKYENHSPNMREAIVAIVRDEDEEPLTDDQVRLVGQEHGLAESEIETLVEIAQGPIGY